VILLKAEKFVVADVTQLKDAKKVYVWSERKLIKTPNPYLSDEFVIKLLRRKACSQHGGPLEAARKGVELHADGCSVTSQPRFVDHI